MLNFLFLFQNGLYLNKYSECYYLKHAVSIVVLAGTKNITIISNSSIRGNYRIACNLMV